MKDLKILFLAQYAPSYHNKFLNKNPIDILYAQYHQDIYTILKSEFDSVISSTTPDELIQNHNHYDFIFTLLNKMHFRNSEVFVSSVCEYYGIPYLGATPNIRAIAEDKHIAKLQAEHLGIQTSPWIIVNYNEKDFLLEFSAPYFVKPRYGATSAKIDDTCVCNDIESAKKRVNEFQAQKIDVIIEQYIRGKNYTIGILNNFGNTYALPPVLESGNSPYGIVTYEEKRKIQKGLCRIIEKESSSAKLIMVYAEKYFNSLKPIDYARIDFIVEDITSKIYFVEMNLCCNLGTQSAMALGAKDIGKTHGDLIKNILYSSITRQLLQNKDLNIYKF